VVKGTISRLLRDRGYGFIRAGDGKALFFYRNQLRGVAFDSLKVGQEVEFEAGVDRVGRPAAVNVKLPSPGGPSVT